MGRTRQTPVLSMYFRQILFFKNMNLCSTASDFFFFLNIVNPSGLMLFLTDILIVLDICVISYLFVIFFKAFFFFFDK